MYIGETVLKLRFLALWFVDVNGTDVSGFISVCSHVELKSKDNHLKSLFLRKSTLKI